MPAKSCLLSTRLRPKVPRSATVLGLAIRMTSVLCSSPSAPMLTSLTIQATLPLPQREYRSENTSSGLAPPISRQSPCKPSGCGSTSHHRCDQSSHGDADAARRLTRHPRHGFRSSLLDSALGRSRTRPDPPPGSPLTDRVSRCGPELSCGGLQSRQTGQRYHRRSQYDGKSFRFLVQATSPTRSIC